MAAAKRCPPETPFHPPGLALQIVGGAAGLLAQPVACAVDADCADAGYDIDEIRCTDLDAWLAPVGRGDVCSDTLESCETNVCAEKFKDGVPNTSDEAEYKECTGDGDCGYHDDEIVVLDIESAVALRYECDGGDFAGEPCAAACAAAGGACDGSGNCNGGALGGEACSSNAMCAGGACADTGSPDWRLTVASLGGVGTILADWDVTQQDGPGASAKVKADVSSGTHITLKDVSGEAFEGGARARLSGAVAGACLTGAAGTCGGGGATCAEDARSFTQRVFEDDVLEMLLFGGAAAPAGMAAACGTGTYFLPFCAHVSVVQAYMYAALPKAKGAFC